MDAASLQQFCHIGETTGSIDVLLQTSCNKVVVFLIYVGVTEMCARAVSCVRALSWGVGNSSYALSVSISLSLCLSVSLSLRLSVSFCLSVSVCLCLSDCLCLCLCLFLSLSLSLSLSICLSVYLSICLSVYLSICLSIYPSIHLTPVNWIRTLTGHRYVNNLPPCHRLRERQTETNRHIQNRNNFKERSTIISRMFFQYVR